MILLSPFIGFLLGTLYIVLFGASFYQLIRTKMERHELLTKGIWIAIILGIPYLGSIIFLVFLKVIKNHSLLPR